VLHSIKNLSFECGDFKDINSSFDVVTSTLVCHHLGDEEIVLFLKKASVNANQAVIINDLHRHWIACQLFALSAPLLFKNRLISHDGLISIQRSFIRKDWESYLTSAKIAPASWSINWFWAFRWIVMINSTNT
jgi:2-polyprenyl-3-methyl-5-hydroxy-6-metoxy-1,4-benzoquinol methylase